MGHTWDILVPSPCTLKKKRWKWDKYVGNLIHPIGRFSCMHLTLFYTLDDLKEFEQAGCALLYEGMVKCEWSDLYEEIERFKEQTSYMLNRQRQYIGNVEVVMV